MIITEQALIGYKSTARYTISVYGNLWSDGSVTYMTSWYDGENFCEGMPLDPSVCPSIDDWINPLRTPEPIPDLADLVNDIVSYWRAPVPRDPVAGVYRRPRQNDK